MKYNSKLTKRYYFPIVQGSNYGFVFQGTNIFNAFVTYIQGKSGITKVTNYSQIWHWFARAAVEVRRGYYVGWWKEGKEMLRELDKANKYLNRQYNRMDKHLRNGDQGRALAIWRILHRRSNLWWLVLFIRKTEFLNAPVLRVKYLMKSIRKLARKESANLKFKRVFLTEYKTDGSVKKHRPLGVPSVTWRVIAASYEFILVNLWAADWSKNQYACMPGRGVADAWIAILTKLTDKDRVREIVGYDLAKFFDTVHNNWIHDLIKFPGSKPLKEWVEKVSEQRPKVKPADYWKERDRMVKQMSEVLMQTKAFTLGGLYRYLYQYEDKKISAMVGNPNLGFPQGLNVSPILSCRMLQWTGALDHPNIVQYMDDGVILNTRRSKLTIGEFAENLMPTMSGLKLSEGKTEVIMRRGIWLKPLKFLGCSYDGRTFMADTRKGKFVVENADQRISEIIEWLRKNRHLLGNYRKLLTSLIAEGWNPPAKTWWSMTKEDYSHQVVNQFSTWWEQTKVKVERLPINCVEAMAVVTLSPKLGPITSSSNTSSMVGCYYLLKYSRACKASRRVTGRGEIREPNRLMADW